MISKMDFHSGECRGINRESIICLRISCSPSFDLWHCVFFELRTLAKALMHTLRLLTKSAIPQADFSAAASNYVEHFGTVISETFLETLTMKMLHKVYV